ncbi:MAG: enoyl-CoA hydratase/isomerase family protein [Chloroflexi bacterium]|nr:enoyl-CoA hydratase/isomerase family protein [Chloroflexota bacterium]
MEFQDLLYEKDVHIATITLNRPDRLNAISGPMLESLSRALIAADDDIDVRVIILTGAGRGFCSGLDLKAHASGTRISTGTTKIDLRNAPPIVLHNVDKPVICALNGPAAGYGTDLALGCDIRVASEEGKLGAVFTKRGVVPESGGTWLLPRLIGWARAAEVAFTGRMLSAHEALDLGLINKVVPADDLMREARALAEEIAGNAPLAVQATKRMMRLGLEESFEANVHHVFLQLRPLMQSEDFQEALTAFLDKRTPRFKGR